MIKYKELSVPLKMAVVAAWILGIVGVLQFMIGFYLGFTGNIV